MTDTRPHFWLDENDSIIYGENLDSTKNYVVGTINLSIHEPIEDNSNNKDTTLMFLGRNTTYDYFIIECDDTNYNIMIECLQEIGMSSIEMIEEYNSNFIYSMCELTSQNNYECYIEAPPLIADSWSINNKTVQSLHIGQKEIQTIERVSDGAILYQKDTSVILPTPITMTVSATKDVLSLSHSDSTTLTATVFDNNNDIMENQVVTFKNGSTTLGTDTTDSNGEASYTYQSVGDGDITITVECGILTETYEINDYLFVPPLNGTDSITKWSTLTNTTENGVFQSHGSYLSNGWDNSGLWQLDFDVRTSSWRYVGLMPFCDSAINPFTDAKNNTYSVTCWEGFTCPGGMGFSNISAPSSYSKKTATNTTYHMTIKKTASNRVEFILENNSAYTWVKESSLLANYSTLYFGSRDNPASRNSGGILQFSNIIVKPLGND